jgi:hypothetical protein
MSTENLAMLAVGQIIAAGMFALGVLVGCSLQKDVKDDNDKGTKEAGEWHQPRGIGVEGGAFSRRPGGAHTVAKADLPIRAPIGRGSVWE